MSAPGRSQARIPQPAGRRVEGTPATGERARPWLRVVAWIGAGAALAATFLAYQSPHLALDLANRLWACF